MKSIRMAIVLALFVAAAAIVMTAQEQVFVPGNTNGGFGNKVDVVVPLVPSITVSGPGTITITYVSGTVTDSGINTGPDGVSWNCTTYQLPLQEANSISGGRCPHLDGLIGVFVPQSRIQDPRGFNAVDGTKNTTRVGIPPNCLFLVGTSKTLHVSGPGTLFLGINDAWIGDNGGGFFVAASFQ